MSEERWWKSETGIALTSWRGRLRHNWIHAGRLALWQEPLFTSPTVPHEADEKLSDSVPYYERYCRRLDPTEASWPKDYYHSKGWEVDAQLSAGIAEVWLGRQMQKAF